MRADATAIEEFIWDRLTWEQVAILTALYTDLDRDAEAVFRCCKQRVDRSGG